MTGSRKNNKPKHAAQKLPQHLRASKALQARDEARRIRNTNSTLKAELDHYFEQLSGWARHLAGKEALLCRCCSADGQTSCACVAPLRIQSPSPEEPLFITRWRNSTGTPVSLIEAGWRVSDESDEGAAGDIDSSSEDSSESSSGWGWSRLGLRRDGRM